MTLTVPGAGAAAARPAWRHERTWFAAALLALAAGFAALGRIDARAENLWTFAGCGLILSGYLALMASILLRRD